MSDALAFLTAALDAAQRDAEAANRESGDLHPSNPIEFILAGQDITTSATEAAERHIRRHDPAAVLRRIAADRKILEWHTSPHTVDGSYCCDCDGPCTHRGEARCEACGDDGCHTLRFLAEGWGWTEETP